MTAGERMMEALNVVAKWRSVFAGWQLGTRPADDPECRAVRDHREVTIILRVEVSALVEILVRKGICTREELEEMVAKEAEALERRYEGAFPGFRATRIGMVMDPEVAGETTRGWRP